ncbi:hypothetical protein DRO61_12765 [Candidatus Bathyarchaeota archaeon]|nr:MAG: hypothetical protein DRO61_12765 [Candidatus Bathyarchaeota archaeon]
MIYIVNIPVLQVRLKMAGFDKVNIDTENITLEECTQILDTADTFYLENKTYSNAVLRVRTYTVNIQPLPVNDKVGPITRMIDIFIDDWNTQQILLGHEVFRQTFKDKMIEIEDKFNDSDLEEVSELLGKIEQIKHIIQEIENEDSDEVYGDDSSLGCEGQSSELDGVSDFSWTDSDDDI